MEPCEYGCRGGHIFDGKVWRRCKCVEERIYKHKLGVFATKTPKKLTKLSEFLGSFLVIEGSMGSIRPHVAGVLISMIDSGKTFAIVDAYSLVEIFLDKDESYSTLLDLVGLDLVIILMGFGDVKNQRLPELIMQLFARRELIQKPVWAVLGVTQEQLSAKYSDEVRVLIGKWKRVIIK